MSFIACYSYMCHLNFKFVIFENLNKKYKKEILSEEFFPLSIKNKNLWKNFQ